MKKAFKHQSSVVRLILIFFVLLILLLSATYYLQPALAVDSSPSSDIQSKLKVLQEEIASRAANIKNEVSKKLQNKAYIGEIKSKDSISLTIGLKSETGNISLNEFTEYIIKSKTLVGDAGSKNLAVADSIVALGDVDDKGILTAKRIIKNSKPPIFKKVVHGILSSVATSSAVLKTIQNEEFTITFDKNTDYQTGKSDGSFTDIKTNILIIAVVEESSTQPLLTKFVYIFPSTIRIKPKISTPSATPTPR